MRNTFKVLYYLKKGKETADGKVMIMARITVNGEVCQFSTKQKIDPKNWSKQPNYPTKNQTPQSHCIIAHNCIVQRPMPQARISQTT